MQQGPSGPPQPAVFTSTKVHYISHVYAYHWNNGKGSPPGRVSLRRADGTLYGPWEISAFAGESNAPNVNWVAEPRIVVPAGTYTVQDSEPKTWSYNATSGYRGFTIVKVLPME